MGTRIIKFILVFSFILLYSLGLQAQQQPVFKVYAVNGKVQVHKPGKKYRILKVSDELTGNETIKVANGAVLNLVCASYVPVQINKAGTYKVENLKGNCSKEQSGLFTQYFAYIWSELLHKHTKPEAAPLQNMKNKGAVSRGCPGIQVFYPTDTLKLANKNWTLNWKRAAGVKVKVSVFDSEYDGLQNYTSVVADSSVSTAAFCSGLSENELNYLEIIPEGATGSCPRYPVIKTSQSDFDALMASYMQHLPNQDSASYFFMRSLLEEDLKYLGEALANLKKAIEKDPDNAMYQKQLTLFKARNNVN